MNKIYFGGLNELRAIAALAVVIHHIEQYKGMNGLIISNPNFSFFIFNLGKASVSLFFVLSSFLITYLLLQEKTNNNGYINIGKFYLRRIFRIWPLYYLIMFISFVVIPLLSKFYIFEYNKSILELINNVENYSFKSIMFYLTFLPQYGKLVIGASQAWSIGVEEQFYLIMPLIFSFFNRKTLFIFIMFLGCIYNLNPPIHNLLFELTKYYGIMGIGVIGGYLYFYNSKRINTITKSNGLYFLIFILILVLMVCMIFEKKWNRYVLGILFLFLILFTINKDNTMALRNKKLSYLGKISYGIYMYHPFVLFLIFPLVNKYFLAEKGSNIAYNFFLYLLSFIVTIFLSTISFEFFESKFIKIKDEKYKSL